MKKTLAVFLSLLMLFSVFGLPAWAENAVPEVSSYEETVALVRERLTARNESFAFRYTGGDWTEPTFDDLCANGGDAAAGDYLRLSFRALPQFTANGDGTYTVSAAFYTDARQEAAVDAYVSDVIAGCTAETDYEKAAYIYGYLCDNVQFDLENLYNEEDQLKYTAYGAAVNGRAVCQGFATLFYRLALAAGLDCRIVTGTRSGQKHAWNIMLHNGEWYHVDASCGAQVLDPSPYFMRGGLPGGYRIVYDDCTAAEIQSFSFAPPDEEYTVGAITPLISYSLNRVTGEITFSGSGNFPNKTSLKNNPITDEDMALITKVVFEEGITGVGMFFFSHVENLREIWIPAGMTSISSCAFAFCPSLEKIEVDDGNTVYFSSGNCIVRSAEKELVLGCRGCVIPDDGSVTKIAGDSFIGSELGELTIPDSITELESLAFYESGLTSIRLPDSLTKIGSGAFSSCSLTSVTIGAGMSAPIPADTFDNCPELQRFTVEPGNLFYSVDSYGVLYNYDKSELIKYPSALSITDYTVPEGVTRIAGRAFACDASISAGSDSNATEHLQSVTLPESLTAVGAYAFFGCKNLTAVNIDSMMAWCGIEFTAKDEGYSSGTASLNRRGVSSNPLSVANDVLLYLNGEPVTELIIPDGVEEISAYAFDGYVHLVSAAMPDSVRSVGMRAFRKTGLKNVTLSNQLSGELIEVFNQCPLESVAIPDSITNIEDFYDCRNLSDVVLPDSVKQIYGFNNCISLTNIDLPENVEYINAFDGCTGLTSVVIPNSVTEMNGFNGCTNLTRIVIPPSVTKIAPKKPASPYGVFTTFKDCSSLTIYGQPGSYAEEYAAAQDIPFKAVCSVTNGLHDETVIEATEADCVRGAYSAGEKCVLCGMWLTEPTKLSDPLGHDPAEPVRENVTEPTCTAEGSYDNVVYCARCGEVLASTPEKIATLPHADGDGDGYCDDCGENICGHPQTVFVNRRDATCTENGYSGDTVCAVCGVTLSYGATVFAPGHHSVCTLEAAPSTCVDAGHTAEYACSVCGTVLTESEEISTGAHADADGDGRCDVCLSPVDCTVFGRCGDAMFWYAENGVLVISGGGDSYDFGDVPWADRADEIDTVYIREGVEAVDADGLAACPALKRIYAPALAAAEAPGVPVTRYAFSGGEARLSGATEFTLYDLLNTAYVLCVDNTVASMRFDTLRLNAADGGEYTEYDILKKGKIIDENHFRIPDGAALSDVRVAPLGYRSFNVVLDELGRHPDKNLILRVTCTDLLPEELKADADLYTEQIAIRFVDEPSSEDEEEQSVWDAIAERFQATLAALLGLFKKVVKFIKRIFGK